jgi:predicted O-linked N-acetylglucosamine transferase (SPINDLY family)
MLQELYRQQVGANRREYEERLRRAVEQCREARERDDRDPDPYRRLAKAHESLGEDGRAIDVLREGTERCAPSLPLYWDYIEALEVCNRTPEAILAARQARALFPEDLGIRLTEALLLPVLYRTVGEIDHYRRRFSSGLAEVTAAVSLATPAARHNAMEAVAGHTNFYLPYQGHNDLPLQQEYGKLVHRIVAANYPGLSTAVPVPPTGEKLRVGYVSAHFHMHSVTKLFLRWLQEHDRERFEVYAYHVRARTDGTTDEVRRCSTKFRHVTDAVENVARAIRADRLHVLVFLDIGMNTKTIPLAAFRLAPVQCMAWGHPVTSGLPTVDYFLSSALMEPPDGREHYSEQLIRLPGVGMCYQKPIIPRPLLGKTRRDFGLREDATLYLSCQASFKYLPQHDDVFPAIAKRLPSAQFVFLTLNEGVRAAFRERLGDAFSAAGLAADEHCVFLPMTDSFSYWNLNLLADVYLDTIEWSGGNTTLEAIACGLPIVTLPGRLMRGRHSYAILTQLGATETIARDKEDYVDIAVRLGKDRGWRDCVVRRANAGCQRFYSDTSSLAALEDFFRGVVRERLRAQEDESGASPDQAGASTDFR